MNNSKKVIFISCFNAYDNRIKHIESILKERGYESIFITSNFNHISKSFYKINRENTIEIDTLEYRRNLSLRRLLSHYLFSKSAMEYVKTIQPDILYVMLPPNSLAYFASRYKKKYNPKLIFDIYDLWPETIPSKNYKTILSIPFKVWGHLRNKNLKYADVVVTECDLFRKKVRKYIDDSKAVTLYPLKITEIEINNNRNNEVIKYELNICYLGSINNIIDIDGISDLLGRVNKTRTVIVHIIGDGEKRKQFVKALEEKDIRYKFYGPIYDDSIKQEIFDKCVLGINIMKDTVCVGLSLKSIDYLSAGLPLLNNIKGDTYEMIKSYGIGINVEDDLDVTAHIVAKLDAKKVRQLRKKTVDIYRNKFSILSFSNRVNEILSLIKVK